MVEFWETTEFWGVVIAGIVGLFGFLFSWRSNNTQKKKIKISSLFRVFELLHSPQQIEARGAVFREYCKFHPTGKKLEGELDVIFSEEARQIIPRVRSAFGQINVLIEEGLLEEKLFLRLNAGMVIRSWKAMEEYTKEELGRNEKIATEFQRLREKAGTHYKEVLKEDEPEPYCPDEIKEDSGSSHLE